VAAGPDHPAGRIGVIASVTAPFCASCDRTRLTADGQIRTCLFSHTETDLRTPLRAGTDDATLADLWSGAHATKPAGHGIGDLGFHQPARTMSSIGG
jgi:cyclic pyranopterin phosphate synthase